ncbi:MAG: hypothetical protein KDE09_26025, partial [Anaerolineales bacterium]|nr:hypothetical protein [Anaerolineales bacterium]
GLTAEAITVAGVDGQGALEASGHSRIVVEQSTWVALRVRGSYHGNPEQIAAHSSAIQLIVDRKPLFAAPDAMKVLEQIEGAMAYVDTLAPQPEAARFKAMRSTLESAYNRLHQRLHQQGVFHRHTPLHGHDGTREH